MRRLWPLLNKVVQKSVIRKAGLALILLVSGLSWAISQNRAPSCWLKYDDSFRGDLLINTVRVVAPSPLYTYYCTMQWNAGGEAGGYCGIQEHPDWRNFIFSIWDPIASTEPIRASYLGEGTRAENFGGEGTGLKSWNFDLGWETGVWYTLVTRAWDYHGHTHFGYWVFDQRADRWHHLVTMDFPIEGVRFTTSTGSFIEDWLGNGWNAREFHQKNGWKRASSGRFWRAFESAYFERVKPDAGANNYLEHYNGGIGENDYFYMTSGGSTAPVDHESGSTLNLDQNLVKPQFDPIELSKLSLKQENDNLLIDWELASHSVPQFSFRIDLSEANSPANSITSLSGNVPQQRSAELNIQDLNPGEYLLSLVLDDLFGLSSDTLTEHITVGNLGIRSVDEAEISVFCEGDFLHIGGGILWDSDSWDFRLFDIHGQVLSQGKIQNKITLRQVSGILFLELISTDRKQRVIKRIYKK